MKADVRAKHLQRELNYALILVNRNQYETRRAIRTNMTRVIIGGTGVETESVTLGVITQAANCLRTRASTPARRDSRTAHVPDASLDLFLESILPCDPVKERCSKNDVIEQVKLTS